MSRTSFFQRIGLGGYLALIMGSLIMAMTMAIVVIVGWRTSADVKASIGRELEELAFQTTDKLDRGMFERYREVQLLAERSLLADASVSLDSKRALLESMQRTYPTYAWIGLTNLQGKVLASTGKMLEGMDVSKRPWFGGALHSVYLHDVHEAVLLAKLLPKEGPEPPRFFDVAFPYRDASGAHAGVLGTHLSWQWAREVERSVLRPLANRSQVDTLILSRNGDVLLGPKELAGTALAKLNSFQQSQRTSNGYTVERWADGKDYLVGYSKSLGYLSYPGFGWTVLVRQQVHDAYAPLDQLRRNILLIGISAALVFSLIGFAVARRITRPVGAIARAAVAVENGEASDIDVDTQYREVASLAGTLNSLVHKLADKETSLRALNASLEERVAERTEALGRALEELALDNAERVKVEQALRQSQHSLVTVTDNMPAAILYIDRDERFRVVNRTYLDWHGTTASALIGKTLAEIYVDEDEYGARYANIAGYVARALAGERVVFDISRRIAGSVRHAELTYIPDLDDSTGEVAGFFVMIQDITERKNAQLEFEHHALHDVLTGLPNRRAFMDRLDGAIARAVRHQKALAVLFLDLNKFKAINDTLGHAEGDAVLIRFGDTLRRCVRKTDTVARLAGDEFIILAEELVGGESDAILIADKIMDALKAQPPLNAELGTVTSSIGIALYNMQGESAAELVARADHAMYESKKLRSNGWALA